jgi:hypothetical protein
VSSPLGVPGAKLTLFAGGVMSLVGIVGVSQGLAGLVVDPSELSAMAVSPDADFNAALTAVQRALLTGRVAKALSVANLILSALLVVASVRLTTRAPTAFWWAKQALWSNAAYCSAAIVGYAYLFESYPPLVEAVDALAAANVRLASSPPGASEVDPRVFRIAALLGTTAHQPLLAAAYLGLLRLLRRDDVKRFVLREA